MHRSLGIVPFLAQTLAEYGASESISAKLAAARSQIETYIGQGNTKYLLLGVLVVLILLLARRRR